MKNSIYKSDPNLYPQYLVINFQGTYTVEDLLILKKAFQMKVDTEICPANLTKGDFWSISSVNPIKKVTKEDIKKTFIDSLK